jgi:hypothetical protein
VSPVTIAGDVQATTEVICPRETVALVVVENLDEVVVWHEVDDMQAPSHALSHARAPRGVAELFLVVTAPYVDSQGTEDKSTT